MRLSAIKEFANLLDRQTSGDTSSIEAIRALAFSQSDGCCLYHLYAEWCGAFSYSPGRKDALELILALAMKLPRWKSDNPAYMYKQPEWSQLLVLRGPVEFIDMYRCDDCGRSHAIMVISPFLGLVGLVCPTCCDVHFRSGYDESPLPMCHCGSSYAEPFSTECAICRNGLVKVGTVSPYEYFETNSYTIADG